MASLIIKNFEGKIDKEDIIKACLLHDLGNIVKFDFNYTKEFMPELVDPAALSRWEEIQRQYREKYGRSSHEATIKMLKELGIDGRVRELVDWVGFSQAEDNAATDDFNRKVCAYSDMRVEPNGVVSLEERFMGLRHRYQGHKEGEGARQVFEKALRRIEEQIFERCRIKPEDVTEQAIAPLMEDLKDFEI